MMALLLWFLGYPDQALKKSPRGSEPGPRGCLTPLSSLLALGFAAILHLSAEKGKQPKSGQRQSLTLSTEHGFTQWLAWGTIYRGWALAEQGQGEEGIAQIRQGLAAYRATGAEAGDRIFLPFWPRRMGK